MKDVRKIIEEHLIRAKKEVLHESLIQKTEIVKLVKQLLAGGIDKTEIDKTLDFYKYSLDNDNTDVENDSIFDEMVKKLKSLTPVESTPIQPPTNVTPMPPIPEKPTQPTPEK